MAGAATITITHTGQTQTLNEVNALDDGIQRIRDAYFAKKIVTDTNGSLSVSFERINEGILGRQVYLVLETNNMRGLEIDVYVQPTDNVLTGNTNDLTLSQGTNNLNKFTTTVGDYTPLNNTSDSHSHYTNLNSLSDKAIIKLELKPPTANAFNQWAQNIGQSSCNIKLSAERADGQEVAFKNDAEEKSGKGEFLQNENFRITNSNVFEIFHPDNEYNNYQQHDNNRRLLGKILNPETSSVKYFYHTAIDTQIEVSTLTVQSVAERTNGAVLNSLPPRYTQSYPAPAGGNAQMNYLYANGDIVTAGNHSNRFVRYGVTGNMIEIVRMPDTLNINTDGTILNFSFSSSQRRYCNPDCFAAFVGVLGICGFRVQSTGMCFGDATSYPSVSHPNGDSVDTVYLANRANQQTLANAFVRIGFTQVIAGTNYRWITGMHLYNAGHNNHLHSGNFSNAFVEPLNPQ